MSPHSNKAQKTSHINEKSNNTSTLRKKFIKISTTSQITFYNSFHIADKDNKVFVRFSISVVPPCNSSNDSAWTLKLNLSIVYLELNYNSRKKPHLKVVSVDKPKP